MAEGTKSILEQIMEESTADVMEVMYQEINKLFGAGNQLFTMEFPARTLNASDYEYNADNCYSVLTKPYPVQEAEFKLSDEMFDMENIVQGNNGEKLSEVFGNLLNNYVPKLDDLKSFVTDKQRLREWLLKEVDAGDIEINGKVEEKLSRMAISKELYREFLEMRNEWYKEKNRQYDIYKAKNDLDGYAKWVSTEGKVREEEINNYFNDAVVRGNYHEVLTMLGFLNVSSPAEMLEKTKQDMRSCVRRSLDGSSDIYTVQFEPSDWFKSLRPNLHPKDLTMSQENLLVSYKSKKKRMADLQEQLSEIELQEGKGRNPQQIQEEIEKLESAVVKADNELMASYGEGAVSTFKMALNIFRHTANPLASASEVVQSIEQKKDVTTLSKNIQPVYHLLEDYSVEAMKGIANQYQTQGEYLTNVQKLAELKAELAAAQTGNYEVQKVKLQSQIKSLQEDLDFLRPLLSGVLQMSASGTEEEPSELLPEKQEDAEDFMDIIITQSAVTSASEKESSSSSVSKKMKASGWFFSAEKSSSQQNASEHALAKDQNLDLQIGMRVKKVTFTRGGWFNPTIFKMSKAYYHLTDMQNLMNGFTTGFLIAKDMTVKFQVDESQSESCQKFMQSDKASSGGFFGFRCSSAESARSNSETAYSGSAGKYFYIRIPGPQILGWFQEATAKDVSEPYKALSNEIYSDVIKDLK